MPQSYEVMNTSNKNNSNENVVNNNNESSSNDKYQVVEEEVAASIKIGSDQYQNHLPFRPQQQQQAIYFSDGVMMVNSSTSEQNIVGDQLQSDRNEQPIQTSDHQTLTIPDNLIEVFFCFIYF